MSLKNYRIDQENFVIYLLKLNRILLNSLIIKQVFGQNLKTE